MAKITKAYILKIDDPVSHEYAKVCAESCTSVGLPFEYFMGYQNQTGASALAKTGIQTQFANASHRAFG